MGWWKSIVSGEVPVLIDPSVAALVERSILERRAHLSADGSLVLRTGKLTGRAPLDKYVVEDSYSSRVIDWSNNVQRMERTTFAHLKDEVLKWINFLKITTYVLTRSVSADPAYALGVRVITTSSPHALFCRHIFRDPLKRHPLGDFIIYHVPEMPLDARKYGLHSSTVIAINFEKQEIIIVGTNYSGEIKKAIFSVMSTLLVERDVLPMHAAANVDDVGNVSLFFGLSGTGKTTLSTDEGISLIGDDEHGLSKRGIFNFEGGCYAKTFGLTAETEPDIFKASSSFGTLLENVYLDPKTRTPNFSDDQITQNGRATYPLNALSNFHPSGMGPLPSNIFFLSADALGILPAVSHLDMDQALYFFLSGYTAKLAGTETGVEGIVTTFSQCFGAPFMMRRANDYGQLLKKFLQESSINVWLINTGWYGGPEGVGKRFPLDFTRQCIRSIQKGYGETAEFYREPVFSLKVPQNLQVLNQELLNPMARWSDERSYFEAALNLKSRFDQNYRRFNPPSQVSSSAHY